MRKVKFLALFIAPFLVFMCLGAYTINYDTVSNPETLTTLLRDRCENRFTFKNDGYIDGQTANVFKFSENSEDMLWTWGTNSITATSTTGVVLFDWGSIIPVQDTVVAGDSQGAANSVWLTSNSLIYEGATSDAYETTISPEDATADNVITVPDDTGTVMTSTLSTNGQDVANSIWGVSGGIRAEGATADAFEATLAFTDPTGDRTITVPEMGASSALLASTLTTNAADVANSVWGASNSIVAEGATADGNETSISFTDPTADNVITIPNDTLVLSGLPDANTTVDANVLTIPVTSGYVAKTTGAGAEALTLADGVPGQILVIELVTDGGGDGTLTPTTASFATIVFADAGDTATLEFMSTIGWVPLGLSGNAGPPAMTQ